MAGFGGGGEHRSAFGGLFGKESQAAPDVYLNLTSLMDVMSNILFFLLAAFGVSAIAILPTTVPMQSAEGNSVEEGSDRVTVMLRADATSIEVSITSATLATSVLDSYTAKLEKKKDGYDLAGLTEALHKIKEKFPASKTLILVPDDDIKYQVLVNILDAARDYHRADGTKATMFPEAVLSSLFSGDDAAAAAPAPGSPPTPAGDATAPAPAPAPPPAP
jgi:biopolymer transport protein ExbD